MNLRIVIIMSVALIILASCATNAEVETPQPETEKEITKVVTIEEKTFEKEDLDFYTLMNKLKLVLQKKEGANEEYIEEQIAYYENVNVNLQSLIELYAMSLLAEEKNYFVPEEKLHTTVKEFKENMDESEEASAVIEEFGREKFNRNIEEYIRETLLRDRIAGELEAELIEENPEAAAQEISYMLEKKFEDLYMDQLSTLEMEIHLE